MINNVAFQNGVVTNYQFGGWREESSRVVEAWAWLWAYEVDSFKHQTIFERWFNDLPRWSRIISKGDDVKTWKGTHASLWVRVGCVDPSPRVEWFYLILWLYWVGDKLMFEPLINPTINAHSINSVQSHKKMGLAWVEFGEDVGWLADLDWWVW